MFGQFKFIMTNLNKCERQNPQTRGGGVIIGENSKYLNCIISIKPDANWCFFTSIFFYRQLFLYSEANTTSRNVASTNAKKGCKKWQLEDCFLVSSEVSSAPTNQPTNPPTIKVSQLSLLIQCFLRFCQLCESLILRTAVCMKYDVEE